MRKLKASEHQIEESKKTTANMNSILAIRIASKTLILA